MKERPILFSAPMVRAILDGRKTQTRRVVLPKPDERYGAILWGSPRYDNGDGARYFHTSSLSPSIMQCWADACPFGKPGDRLWVRETFVVESNRGLDNYPPPFSDGRPLNRHSDEDDGDWWEQPHYAATDPTPDLCYEDSDEPACRWKPSIHMPRWASRITLEITDLRVERVQQISRNDANAEGIDLCANCKGYNRESGCACVEYYAELWDSLNEKRGYGWDSNPWVWVIEFKGVEQQQKAAA